MPTTDGKNLSEIDDGALDASDDSTTLGSLGAPCTHQTFEGTPSKECVSDLLCEYTATPGTYRCTRACVFDSDSAADDPACEDSGGILGGRCIHELPGDPTIPSFCDLAK